MGCEVLRIGREGKAARHRTAKASSSGMRGRGVRANGQVLGYFAGKLRGGGTNRRAIGRTLQAKWAAKACDLSQIKHFSVQERHSASPSPGTVRTRLRLDTSSTDGLVSLCEDRGW